ncbi:putative membrane protein YqhA [Ochrobactrum sp. 19YEA23]|uniref:YqhA family protein n=1 Tax=Ochrobactrum sp. 19YEA23 TaxID=3039854 RepID=UPI00247A517C|nr:putative membrane protein YqhA [Ochrobactrum sp. 19YEA23]
MFTKILSLSRYIMILPVIGALFGSIALIMYQIAVMASASFDILKNLEFTSKASKTYAVRVVETVDVFLIAIAVYIISLGLYSLFIDDRVKMPSWLKISNLEDLKEHLLSVVVAVLGVLFLSEAVAWDGTRDVFSFGLAISAAIAALAFFLKQSK